MFHVQWGGAREHVYTVKSHALWEMVLLCPPMDRQTCMKTVIKTKSWLKVTHGFIPRKMQWHIHTGQWSLVN